MYWSNFGVVAGSNGSVWRAGLDGGSATPLATGQDGLYDIAVDAKNVYWTVPGNGVVMKAPIDSDGGAAVQLASGQNAPYGIAVDSTHVYWVNELGGEVMKVAIGGGAPVSIATGQSYPIAIAVDATSVYWTNNGPDGRIMKLTPK